MVVAGGVEDDLVFSQEKIGNHESDATDLPFPCVYVSHSLAP